MVISKDMKTLILTIFFLSISTSFAKSLGGATSGGGDLIGIEATKILSQVFDSILKVDDKLYSINELEVIEKIKNQVNLIMVDNELSTNTKDAIQNGAAFSIREDDKATIFIKRSIWNNIPTLLEREVLIHHEIMILAGIEETGDYSYSLKYEKLRENFWKIAEYKNIFCTINLFKKTKLYGMTIPGDLIGSSSSLMPFSGAKGDWGILKSDSKKALIWRGVIDSSGLFKMEIGEVDFYPGKSQLPKSFSVNFGTFKSVEEMHTYVDPYQMINPVQNPLVFTDKHTIVVNCNKLDADQGSWKIQELFE